MTKTRQEALAVIAEISTLAPDVRLGQLFAHLGFLSEDETGNPLWTVDDEQLLATLHRHRAELINRMPPAEYDRNGTFARTSEMTTP